MIMIDQSKRLSQPLRWGRREKTAVAALLSCVAIAALALGVFALTSGAPARRDCVTITFASTLGGAEVKGCGGRARRICSEVQAFRGSSEQLREACRRAGFPYG